MNGTNNILISFSGGRTSAFMAWWLLNVWPKRHDYNFAVVFANTGKEREETLEFIQKCDERFSLGVHWVGAEVNPEMGKGVRFRKVDFALASRNGEPFEAAIQKFGLPNRTNPYCTRDLKAGAILDYVKNFIGWDSWNTAIGIRSDEATRISWESAKKNKRFYPLVTEVVATKLDVNYFWSKQPFDLALKSYEGNCDFCWKKSFRKLMTIARDNPEIPKWWIEMEEKYGNTQSEYRQGAGGYTMYRENNSAEDIVAESIFLKEPAYDDSKIVGSNTHLSSWTENLDSNDGCADSCEPF